jgi:5,10-methylene-tetrahydrofolate dehydrogenase/methenyl tetrahydrofolate cyclohydrolase
LELDCRGVAEAFLRQAAGELRALPFKPVLAVVRKGHEPSALAYEKLLASDAAGVGAEFTPVEAADDAGLEAAIARLDSDPGVHGILLMAPLKAGRPDSEYANLLDPAKDVEGRHAVNLGYLYQFKRFLDEARGVKCVVPATAKAVVKLLQNHGLPRPGAFAAIVNDSEVVGRPLGMMLKNLGATVVNCHVGTRREVLEDVVRIADVVVTAVPDPAFRLDAALVKPGAAVVDLSYQGNLDHAAVARRAAFITPAKGGAGLGKVTRAMMFVNLSYCCRRLLAERMGGER